MAGGKIPFDAKTGDLLGYVGVWADDNRVEWRDNYEFEATLKYDGYELGRSATLIRFVDEGGRKYVMLIKDFDYLVKTCGLEFDTVTATWTFVQRGANYRIKLAR